jgi:hypothetical protein
MPTCDDLATKVELEELKDKINKILGAKDGGGYDNVLDEPELVLSLAPAALVGSVLWLQNAFNSLNDIKIVASGEGAIWKELAEGTAQLTGFHGNGVQKEIPALKQIGQAAGTGVQIAGQAAQAANHAAAAANLLASLVSIGMTLALNKATVDILDKRIAAEAKLAADASAQIQNNTLKLYQKHQGSINAINAEIDSNNQKFNDQAVRNQYVKNQLTEQKEAYEDLKFLVDEQQESINELWTKNGELQSSLDAFEAETEARIGEIIDIAADLRYALARVTLLLPRRLQPC